MAATPDAYAQTESVALRGVSDPVRAPPVTCTEDAGACFTLLGVAIDGVTRFSQAELVPLYADYLMREVSERDLARIAQIITDRYRAEGYFLSRAVVPPQDGGGVARLTMIEGRISEIVIEGDAARQVRPYLRRLEGGGIADLEELNRCLAVAGDIPGVSIRSRMEPDPHNPAVHRLIVTADLQRVNARASIDNRGTESVGPWQAYGRVAGNSIFAPRDQLGLALFATPGDVDEFALGEMSYGYMFEHGGRFRAAASASRSHDGADMHSTDVGGDGEALSLAYEFPLMRGRGRGMWLGAAFDMRHQENDWQGGGAYADELRVARVALRGFLDEGGRSSTMFVQASFGLDALGASGHSLLRRSRWDADAMFAKVSVFASHYTDISDHFGLYAAFAGQWASEPLLQSEEFSVGGLPFGRAYSYGEISGDRGATASLELRAGMRPDIDAISFLQAYAFLDGASVSNIGGGEDTLASGGAGLRVTFEDRLTAAFELARPLDGAPTETGDMDWRQFFSLSANY